MRADRTRSDSAVSITPPSLPKGGGAMVGLTEGLSPVGPDGAARLAVPLPLSAGRGYAPVLTLEYSSGAGSSELSLGWEIPVMAIQRRTAHGVPRYDGGVEDEFVGPDGEVLVSERDAKGVTVTTTVTRYGGKTLGASFMVTRYFPRVEAVFDRIERWQGAAATDDFWLIHGADGRLHCLGKTASARVAHPLHSERIAEWRIEESVNPLGEHIYYRYVAENSDNVTAQNESDRDHSANRYLAEVYYGNRIQAADLYLWSMTDASAQGWLFSAVVDYGERGVDPATVPPYTAAADAKWLLRADSFSHYRYGFEVRTHRLARQVLMFHHMPEELDAEHTLVRRLLLTYQESPIVSHLVQVRTYAYEADGTPQSTPPLEFAYTGFAPAQLTSNYQVFSGIAELNDTTHYQMVDLYGDGLPGVLFREGTDWRYRPPVRGDGSADDIAYGEWQALPAVPSMQPARLALLDVDGDGHFDWLVTQPGMAGWFSLTETDEWSGFTPFAAFPREFLHPRVQLADLVGAGLTDLAMIGPQSVRLYANRRDGYDAPVDVPYGAGQGDQGLPIAGRSDREVVAFSDILGSGQAHLVRVRCDGVMCWPNLGRGNFGAPFQVAPLDFDVDTFNPDRVFLADLNGSGAADLIYVEQDRILVYLNQSGNGFAAPVTLALPDGLLFDDLCRVSFADLQGLGVASLVISHRHMAPRHWRLDLVDTKPYLLASIDNNMGGSTMLSYRSSAQYWLDDKQAHPGRVSALPMPIPTLTRTVTLDEVSGNAVTRQYGCHYGVYDGVEREFRGFGLVTVQDSANIATTVQSSVPLAVPSLTRTWYHTGREHDEAALADSPYQDDGAFMVWPTRLTKYNATTGTDVDLEAVDATTRYWLFRALKGVPLRTEVYGRDGTANQAVPYAVSAWRYQVRLLQPTATPASAVVLPGALEQVEYVYERIAIDPVVRQQVQLGRDQYGAVTWQVAVSYPRRAKPADNPYPDSLPASSWASSYDDQQTRLILTEQRFQPIHLDDPQAWRLDLPYQRRGNVLSYDGSLVPDAGLDFEALTQAGAWLDATKPRTYAGQELTVYVDQPVTIAALVDHVETAEIDDATLRALDGVLDATLLQQAGYVQSDRILSPDSQTEPKVWVAPRGYTAYQDAAAFYRPASQRSSQLIGAVSYAYDAYTCMLTGTTDALGNRTVVEYDYRFLIASRILDVNANTQEVLLDALGRPVAGSFYGTEEGVVIGFAPVAGFSFAGLTVESAIQAAGETAQQVASIHVEDPFSWMGRLEQAALSTVTDDVAGLWQALRADRFITAEGWILSAGRAWAQSDNAAPGIPDALRAVILAVPRMPVQAATLLADRYPTDSAQQVRISVSYFDGLTRPLQRSTKTPGGGAWQRDSQGGIVAEPTGQPLIAHAPTRWAVSERVEYGADTEPVRAYQPYYVDDWRYVADETIRALGYADTLFHDAIGRETQVLTAKGYLRRNGFFPWFTVAEDENDTLSVTTPPNPDFGTPTLLVHGNRGMLVRTLTYNRAAAGDPLDERIELTEHDALGRVAARIDARFYTAAASPNFAYVSSLSGQVLRTISVDGGAHWALADVDGRAVWDRDARGTVTAWVYDALGRPLTAGEVVAGLPAAIRDVWIYGEAQADAQYHNLRGRCVRRYDTAGKLAWTAFRLTGQPLFETRQLLADAQADADWSGADESAWGGALDPTQYMTTWLHDATGTWIAQRDAKSNLQERAFDVAGRLVSSSLTPAGGTALSLVPAITHDAAGHVLSETTGNGAIARYAYEPETQRLLGIEIGRPTVAAPVQSGRATIVQALSYQYDPVGNVVSITDEAQATSYWRNQAVEPTLAYRYDALYQLIGATGREMAKRGQQGQGLPAAMVPLPADDSVYSSYTRSYSYDRGGNLVAMQHQGTSNYAQAIVVSDRSNHAIQQAAAGNLQPADVDDGPWFDVAGNQQLLSPDGTQPLTWDGRNRVKQVTLVTRNGIDDDRELYQYGADGMRVRKRLYTLTGGAMRIAEVIYLPGLTLRLTLRDNGQTITVNQSLQDIDCQAANVQARLLRWDTGLPYGVANDQVRYGMGDRNGSVRLELDDKAGLISREEYYPYGGTAIWTARGQVEADTKYRRYSGKERDATGLYYYGYRYYMPWMGRWLSSDPAGIVDSLNLYCMARNNPETSVDRLGLMTGPVKEDSSAPTERRARYMFTPFHDVEEFLLDMRFAGVHAQSKGKTPPMPVFRDEQQRDSFNRLAKSKLTPVRRIVGNLFQPRKQRALRILERQSRADAARMTLHDTGKIRLDISAHGNVGGVQIGSRSGGGELVGAVALAHMLIDLGLPADATVYIASCSSGAGEPYPQTAPDWNERFEAGTLAEVSAPEYSFASRLLRQLTMHSDFNGTVSGYLMSFSSEPRKTRSRSGSFGTHYAALRKDAGGMVLETVRRRDVRVAFRPPSMDE